MIQEGITQIDIKQVLRQKAPSAARKIPGFMVDYLIRTVHQDELNEILRRYHDKDGVAFMQELIAYSLPTIRWADWTGFACRPLSVDVSTGRSATW